jgi:hypothetical protein
VGVYELGIFLFGSHLSDHGGMMGIFAVIVALLYFFPRINFFIK